MPQRTIPQRELRNNVAAILREAEGGERFTITVRGRPVAELGPTPEAGYPKVDVDRGTLRRILATPIDDDFAADLEAAEAPVVDPDEHE